MTTFTIQLTKQQTKEVNAAWEKLSSEGKVLMLAQIHIGWGSLHVDPAQLMVFGITKQQHGIIDAAIKEP